MTKSVLLAATILSGLSAGFYYAWQVSVIPGHRHVSNATFLEGMQSINRAIQNPAFALVFFGTLLALLWANYQSFIDTAAFRFSLAATLVYVFGVLGITMLGNVPLNTMLDQVNLNSLNADQAQALRQRFEVPWNRYHLWRTGMAILSFVLILMAYGKIALYNATPNS